MTKNSVPPEPVELGESPPPPSSSSSIEDYGPVTDKGGGYYGKASA